jgi:DNA mismatch repair ATPase MutL
MSSATSASEIRPIEAESVRRIVAGQAVTDLASAVKELVDNALDAGSKNINSKFKVLHLTDINLCLSIANFSTHINPFLFAHALVT